MTTLSTMLDLYLSIYLAIGNLIHTRLERKNLVAWKEKNLVQLLVIFLFPLFSLSCLSLSLSLSLSVSFYPSFHHSTALFSLSPSLSLALSLPSVSLSPSSPSLPLSLSAPLALPLSLRRVRLCYINPLCTVTRNERHIGLQ